MRYHRNRLRRLTEQKLKSEQSDVKEIIAEKAEVEKPKQRKSKGADVE